ncbi:MAG: L-alanine exporter AlaE [Candidatus Aenigmarchaeota archaeon]|nr:L-alanine exporter AlaE [Candidatus Aenigmarchaeota archaeon]
MDDHAFNEGAAGLSGTAEKPFYKRPIGELFREYVIEPVKTKAYWVDVSGGVGFYTPIMGFNELVFGDMTIGEMATSRGLIALYHMAAMRPILKYRRWYADRLGADESSPLWKKFLVDSSCTFSIQSWTYPLLLWMAGNTPEKIMDSLPFGYALGSGLGIPFGYVIDKWRDLWGTEPPTLYK